MSCCGHDDRKHVVYSASHRDEDGAIVAITRHVICIATHCFCERPRGLYRP